MRCVKTSKRCLVKAFSSIDDVQTMLAKNRYVADRSLAVSIFLGVTLARPLFLEGEAGVGKTEVAKVLAAGLGRPLIRLQCYEGLDVNHALYEWNYAKQILHIRLAESSADGPARAAVEREIFGPEFLIKRPLLQAIDDHGDAAAVLLIDEIDRADEEFEAFLLELLSDFQVTVPEIGTFSARTPPIVVLTSNRTREVHDALKRRCLYHWVEHPDFEREVRIVQLRAPGAVAALARQVAAAVEQMREMALYKPPGVAETIDWALALATLGRSSLDEATADVTLGTVLKYREDAQRVRASGLAGLIDIASRRAATVEASDP